MAPVIMPPIKIDAAKCICSKSGAGQPWPCIADCPGDLIAFTKEGSPPVVAYPHECWYCSNCIISCPGGAIELVFPLAMLI
ncbi:ferredoxin family protein [Chloroflexota bacterium]